MKTCKVKALALAVAYAFTATGSVSAADMQSGKDPMSLMSANSFSVSAPGESRLQYFRRDLIKLLEPYKDKTLSPKEIGRIASETEYKLRQMGYLGTSIKIEKAQGSKPMALAVSYDLSKISSVPKPVTRQEIVKQLQEAVAKEQGKSAAADGKSQLDERLSSMAGTLQSGASAEDKREWLLSTAQGVCRRSGQQRFKQRTR